MPLDEDRAELLELVCAEGIYRGTPEQPLKARDGEAAAWMLDSLRISLTARGAELAGRCLLAKLAPFRGRQLATYGVTAMPLLQSVIALSGGKYTGIVVRKEPKTYGAQRQLEGKLDPREPVIVIDDSISSGGSMLQCIELLEQARLYVEGAVVLVRFGWYGGYARMIGRGHRMAHVLDAREDLLPLVEPERPRQPYNPSLIVPAFEWAERVSSAKHPAHYAREVMTCFVRGEPVPRAPARFDRDYDHAGGTWVSVRSKANIHDRHARDGLWNFPGETVRPLGEDIARAAVRTVRDVKDPKLVDGSAIAVTFFGALERCTVGQLDNDRYGIVVRSTERIEALGGALPRMPGMSREWQQFEHAQRNNAKLAPFEPFALWRHTVDKAVEPGATWQPTGVPLAPLTWQHDRDRAGRVAARALDFARAKVTGEQPRTQPLPDDLIGETESIYVTVYTGGHVAGCMGTEVTKLDRDLRAVTEAALADPRFNKNAGELAVSVSFLDGAEPRGVQAPQDIAIRYRHGDQALVAYQHTRIGILLPFVVLQYSLTPQQYVAEVIDKAGITRPPYTWACLETHTWLATGQRIERLVFGMPPATPPATLDAALAHLTPKLASYLLRHHRADGLRDGYYRPLLDTSIAELELPRQIHGAWILARAHRLLGGDKLGKVARHALETVKPRASTHVEIACLVLATCETTSPDPAHVARLWDSIDAVGRIRDTEAQATEQTELEQLRRDLEQDYTPPQVLLALAAAITREPATLDRDKLDRALAACRHRFEVKHGWGQVAWLPQAVAAWYPITHDAQLAFDVIDWALDYQQDIHGSSPNRSGGFINAEQPDSPGFTTGVYLEGVASALRLARTVNDATRIERYRKASLAALQFLDSITYQERDRPLLPDPEKAYGGVRMSRTASDVRIDFVQHALNALLLLRE